MKKNTANSIWGSILFSTMIALIFLVFMFLYYPFREKIQFDGDEGLNLMRSMLVTMGYPLYTEVSSDQPPLFTLLLGILMRFTGYEVTPARLLVLLFSSLLVGAGVQFLQLTWGKTSAILFLPLSIMIPRYLVLSVSVMIGLPSIALSVLALLFVIIWHKKRGNVWLALSGFALALSVLIKLFSGFLIPIFLIGISAQIFFDNRANKFSWKMLKPVWIWSLCFFGLAVLLGVALVGQQNLLQIVFPHIASIGNETFQGETYTITYHLQAALPLLIVGFFGVLFSIYKQNWPSLYPLAWAAVAYALLSFYSPVSYHHQLLITVPCALLAAAALGEGLHTLVHLKFPAGLIQLKTVLAAGAWIGFIVLAIHSMPTLDKELRNSPRISGFSLTATAGKIKILHEMNAYADQTNWILTDMPMYAFRLKLPVPPSLATFSRKRLVTGSITEEDILIAMHRYQPEQVLMARFEIPALEAYLAENYTLVASPEFFRLFIRKGLKRDGQ